MIPKLEIHLNITIMIILIQYNTTIMLSCLLLLCDDNIGVPKLDNPRRHGNTTAMRLASDCIMGPDWGPRWNPSDHHNTMVLKGLRGALNWAPIKPRDASLPDSGCIVLQCSGPNPHRHTCFAMYLRTLGKCLPPKSISLKQWLLFA